ncbi:tetratricopeptide repeat-containing sulfotransferase family protein [Halofilum ochraceum]|uniref:tetratricopeptide repeat-containing sulfotransferase family protein n=1 Tax=Halofilum ochraceum TaxID=1611323 RepID=UPI0009F6E13B|nr:sulfotransferase [Halofilum ochraceum]
MGRRALQQAVPSPRIRKTAMSKRKTSRAAGKQTRKGARGAASVSPQQQFADLVAAYQAGRYEEVVTGATRFTTRWPDQEAGWNLLAEGQRMMERLDEAEVACRKAVSINPESAEAHNNTANVLRDRGAMETAETEYREALALKPGLVEAHFNLGNLLLGQERLVEAATEFHAAVNGRPNEPLYLYSLGAVLGRLENYADARMALERAVRLQPGYFEAHIELGRVCRELGEYDRSRAAFEQAVALRPESPRGHSQMGTLLQITGDLAGAERFGRKALEIQHDYAPAWYLIANSRDFSASDPELEEMEALLEKQDLGVTARSLLHFALGKAHSEAGADPGLVFRHYQAGCEAMRRNMDYDIAGPEKLMDDIARAFSAEWMSATRTTGDPTDAPIFVVGMPRSGTTLTEQILASHPRVHGAGECVDLDNLILSKDAASGSTFPEWVPGMPDNELAMLGAHYRSRVVDPAAPAERVVDKRPFNFFHLGLIAKALPNARVVHLQRDPVDTCLSCYMQRFSEGHQWTNDLKELGLYYRAYAKLMDHWREVLPEGFMLDFSYEELTANPETQIRRLLVHCGLEWNPACMDFHKTKRGVNTPSVSQVRKPIYRTSVAKWHRFRGHLQPLLDALGPLAPPNRE